MVLPKAKLPGSTSVRCWLLEFVKESQLNSISGTLAGTNVEPAVHEPGEIWFRIGFGSEPQPDAMRMHVPKTNSASPRTGGLPFCISLALSQPFPREPPVIAGHFDQSIGKCGAGQSTS